MDSLVITPKKLWKTLRPRLLEIAERGGFTDKGTRQATLHRSVGKEVIHVIQPGLRRPPYYDILIFASSPIISPGWESRFPDETGSPSTLCFLYPGSPMGIGAGAWPDGFSRESNDIVEQQIKEVICHELLRAISFLDQFQSIEDLDGYVNTPVATGLLAHRLGREEEATQVLTPPQKRIGRCGGVGLPMGRAEVLACC